MDFKHGGGEEIERGCVGRLGEDVLGLSPDSNDSKQKPVPEHHQFPDHQGGSRSQSICGWKCRGAPAVLPSTPGLRRGMEGCGKRISRGSCVRSTKHTPRRSGSATCVTCQELDGHNPWCRSVAVANRERIWGPIYSILGRLLLRFPLWRSVCVPTDHTESGVVRILVLDIPLEEPVPLQRGGELAGCVRP